MTSNDNITDSQKKYYVIKEKYMQLLAKLDALELKMQQGTFDNNELILHKRLMLELTNLHNSLVG